VRVLVVNSQVPFITGGAEVLAGDLIEALRQAGCEAEPAAIPFKWYPPAKILEQMLACRLLDLSESSGTVIDRVIALKFPAYLVEHPKKTIWLIHQHRQAYDLWSHPSNDLIRFPNGTFIRSAIQNADRQCFSSAHSIFSISKNVSRRLKKYNDFDSIPLLPPPHNSHLFQGGEAENFFFFPSRIESAKRQELVVRALAKSRDNVRVVIAGQAGQKEYLQGLKKLSRELGVDGRIQWLGRIPEQEKVSLYSKCRGVLFPPYDEDYGFVTLEAMLSEKPIITCNDSGGPCDLVVHGETGLVATPEPEALGGALQEISDNPAKAASLGRAARKHYEDLNISWEKIVQRLLD